MVFARKESYTKQKSHYSKEFMQALSRGLTTSTIHKHAVADQQVNDDVVLNGSFIYVRSIAMAETLLL